MKNNLKRMQKQVLSPSTSGKLKTGALPTLKIFHIDLNYTTW